MYGCDEAAPAAVAAQLSSLRTLSAPLVGYGEGLLETGRLPRPPNQHFGVIIRGTGPIARQGFRCIDMLAVTTGMASCKSNEGQRGPPDAKRGLVPCSARRIAPALRRPRRHRVSSQPASLDEAGRSFPGSVSTNLPTRRSVCCAGWPCFDLGCQLPSFRPRRLQCRLSTGLVNFQGRVGTTEGSING